MFCLLLLVLLRQVHWLAAWTTHLPTATRCTAAPTSTFANHLHPAAAGTAASGALGGRLDHTLANLNTLYCYPHLNITLWGEGNLVRLLRAGKSVIQPSRLEGPTCGLVPLARPATASSKGLKWDLDDTHVRGLRWRVGVLCAVYVCCEHV
jgi:hypothetical protein